MEQKRSVIVVDDDLENREAMATALEWGGFAVREAQDGVELVSSLTASRPDAVVLDVNMSWTSGVDLCLSLKKNDAFKEIPVVFVSARGSSFDVARGLAAGAAAYLTKPVDLELLLQRLNALTAAPA